MSQYIKTNWKKGDTISSVKMNKIEEGIAALNQSLRVTSLDSTLLATNQVIQAIGNPIFVEEKDFSNYPNFNLTEEGWYVFARIEAMNGVTVSASTTVQGASKYIAEVGSSHIDVAIDFQVAATSKSVTISWDENHTETFVFKATDLAIYGLDYRVTFYVYDVAPYTIWEYALTTDTTFVEDKQYYTKDNDTYTLAEVNIGDSIPADTYYNHSKVIFNGIDGMTRNVTYRCNTIIDCPMEFILPEIEDECHGAWYEIRCQHAGAYSMTLIPPSSDVKIATEHTQKETKGVNMINLHYTSVGGTKLWRFMNTHSSIPA